METSDSECFESADEEFYSDDEVKLKNHIVKNVSPNNNFAKTEEKLNNIKLTPTIQENRKNSDNLESDTSDYANVDNQTDNTQVKTESVSKSDLNISESNVKEVPKPIRQSKIGSKVTKKVRQQTDQKIDVPVKLVKEPSVAKEIIPKPTPANLKEPEVVNNTAKNDKWSTDEEEDLWGDNEIDWGKEATLNNTHLKNASKVDINSKKTSVSEEDSWGSWGNWGVTTILSTATQSVSTLSTLTNHVSQGISTVLETGIGIPEPEALAKSNKEEREKQINFLKGQGDYKSEELPSASKSLRGFGLGNLVKLVESTSTKVISGGLDTLETIGKKTMEVLQEGDPGLKKKRAFLTIDQDRPVLSQLLREAKEKNEIENQSKPVSKKAKNYETLFDDHQGLVHLEALELLSKQCAIKLETMLDNQVGEELVDMQETMDQVKELCELPDEEDEDLTSISELKDKVENAIKEIHVNISYERLFTTWAVTETSLNNTETSDFKELHQEAIESLAQLTAIGVEQFHKIGELLLVKERRSTADEADSLVQLTTAMTTLIGIVAGKFSDKLNIFGDSNKEEVNSLITNVFFEAANSSSYIQDALQLLIPVLQVGAL